MQLREVDVTTGIPTRLRALGAACLALLAVTTRAEGRQAEPGLGPGSVLDGAGSLTSHPREVIAGNYSIKGSADSGSYTPYLRTDPARIFFAPGRTYEITFRYAILSAADRGFEALFYSPTGGAARNFLPSVTITGAPGSAGIATLTSTLGGYDDYEARWNVVSRGAIAIDDIRIIERQTSQVVASENAEGQAPRIRLTHAFLPPGRAARTFSAALAAVGGTSPYTWQSGVLPLPPGVRLASDGFLSGVPATPGSYVFDVVATDARGASARLPLRLTIAPPAALPPPVPLDVVDGIATARFEEYGPAFRNPLGGMRPYVPDAKKHPFASLGRQYIEWTGCLARSRTACRRLRFPPICGAGSTYWP